MYRGSDYEAVGTNTKDSTTSWRLTTGALKASNKYNIYDMAGNVAEWSMEEYASMVRSTRGGDNKDSSLCVAERYGGQANHPTPSYGFRPSLYIK